MNRIAAACITLWLVAGMHPGSASAQARGETVQSIQERMFTDPEVAYTTKRSDLEAWLPRMLGRWRYEVMGQGTARVDCTSVGNGPGVQCISRYVRPDPATNPADAPDFMLIGVDPDLPGVRKLRVSGFSIADHDEAGRLKSDSVTFYSPCPLPVEEPPRGPYIPPTPVRCEHQIRMFASPDSDIFIVSRRTDTTYVMKARFFTVTTTEDQHWQRLDDTETSESVLQPESVDLDSLEQYGKTEIPELTGHVADQAGSLRPAQLAALESKLAAYEKSTSQRIIVATVTQLNGLSIEAFAGRAAANWNLDDEAEPNYTLLVVAPNDGSARIEPGAAMRACVPDATAQQILNEAMIPEFTFQRIHEGIQKGVTSLMNACRDLPADTREQQQ